MSKKDKLLKIFDKMYDHFGPLHWWPADTPFEVVIGAILTQSANWKNVEKAIVNLKKSKALSPKSLSKISNARLQKLIRPSGYFRAKGKKVKAFVKFFLKEYGGSMGKMREEDAKELREELLEVHGIGPETADSILLYALGKPTFVVDAYTKRIGKRVGLFNFDNYHAIKDYFEGNLPRRTKLYNEYHAQLVELGKNFCKTRPICPECPIGKLCAYN
jgi:endonuclease-3 related protein